MTVYCSKWGQLFLRETHERLALLLYSILLYAGILWFLSGIGVGERAIVWMILAAVAVIPFAVCNCFTDHKPRFLTVSPLEFSWQQHLYRHHGVRHRWGKMNIYLGEFATMTVVNMRSIQFKQNFIERKFNMGRICFAADVRSCENEQGQTLSVQPPTGPYECYGIKSFRQFKVYLRANLPQNAFLQ